MTLDTLRSRVALLCAAPLLLAACAAQAAPGRPDKLAILSMTDTKGRLVPCGCHVPKGGLPRQAFFADSVRALYQHTLLVDNGGYFPEMPDWQEDAAFMMKQMRTVGFQAVGVAGRDLKYGLSFLLANAKSSGLPITCANLLYSRTEHEVFPASMLLDVGGTKVGVFALISENSDLGPTRPELKVESPELAATRTVKELRARGAQAIVLLSQLGTIASEDMATAVPGIDAIIVGGVAPVIEQGKRVGGTVLTYAGDWGYYMGATVLSFDARGAITSGESRAAMLGPDLRDNPALKATVAAFEESMAGKRKMAEPK